MFLFFFFELLYMYTCLFKCTVKHQGAKGTRLSYIFTSIHIHISRHFKTFKYKWYGHIFNNWNKITPVQSHWYIMFFPYNMHNHFYIRFSCGKKYWKNIDNLWKLIFQLWQFMRTTSTTNLTLSFHSFFTRRRRKKNLWNIAFKNSVLLLTLRSLFWAVNWFI